MGTIHGLKSNSTTVKLEFFCHLLFNCLLVLLLYIPYLPLKWYTILKNALEYCIAKQNPEEFKGASSWAQILRVLEKILRFLEVTWFMQICTPQSATGPVPVFQYCRLVWNIQIEQLSDAWKIQEWNRSKSNLKRNFGLK